MVTQRDEVRLPPVLSGRERLVQWLKDNVPSFIAVILIWELLTWVAAEPALFPRSGVFPGTFEGSIIQRGYEVIFLKAGETNCILCVHAWHTSYRILIGIAIASVVGVSIGIAMGISVWFEKFMVPIQSMLLPIPALAWSPVCVLWFGLGNATMIFITSFAAALPAISATWTGVKTVNPIWTRAARSMNANGMVLFRKVTLPGSLPFILSGLRIGLARAWRAGIAAEMVAASDWGLGYAIFDSREDLDMGFMLVGIATIALVGFIIEKFLFEKLERATVIKWGMMAEVGSG
ncbi:MAG: ABC transporter permease [Nitrospinota bacterium]|nr:ABC transporter permease [Nitrospinota bacterium]